MGALDILSKARTRLTFSHPFLASLALRLNLAEGEVKAPAINGETLTVPPDHQVTDDAATNLVARAALHCALGHPYRRGNRERARWNEACRIVIEIALEQSGIPAVADHQYDGLSAEQVYDLIEPTAEDAPVDVEDGEGTAEGASATEWKAAAVAAAETARLDSSRQEMEAINRFLAMARRPVVPWRDTLRDFIAPASGRDYSWSKPSRRHIGSGLYLPSVCVTDPGPIRFLIDASGSVSQKNLATFMAEVRAVQDEIHPEAVIVTPFDTRLRPGRRFEQGEPAELQSITAGGGTDYRLLWPEGLEDREADVVVTDGECDTFPKVAPALPVLWIITGSSINRKFKPPFGRAVIVEQLR